METDTLNLVGMNCASCARHIEDARKAVPGVNQCQVNFGAAQATVQYNPQKANLGEIQKAVSNTG